MGRPSNSEQRRAQIAEGLLRVMADVGYDRATIPAIANAARVPSGVVHYHYKDKREILIEVSRLVGERINARISEHCVGFKERLAAYIEVLLGRKYRDPVLMHAWLVLGSEAMRDAAIAREFQDVVDLLLARLTEIVAERLPRSKKKEARSIAAAIFASAQGYYLLAAASPRAIPKGTAMRNVKTLARALIEESSK